MKILAALLLSIFIAIFAVGGALFAGWINDPISALFVGMLMFIITVIVAIQLK